MSITTKYASTRYVIVSMDANGDPTPHLYKDGKMPVYADLSDALVDAQEASMSMKGRTVHILHIEAETKVVMASHRSRR